MRAVSMHVSPAHFPWDPDSLGPGFAESSTKELVVRFTNSFTCRRRTAGRARSATRKRIRDYFREPASPKPCIDHAVFHRYLVRLSNVQHCRLPRHLGLAFAV